MSNDQPTKPKADDLAKNLKASLAQRRPRTWKPVVTALVLASLLLAGMWYWLQPNRHGAPLQVVALDGLFTADETPTARVQLFAPDADDSAPRLSGHTILVFEQMKAAPRELRATSDAHGTVAVDWPMPGASAAEFYAQHLDEERRHKSAAVRGLLFVWPKDAPLLIVDADETLVGNELDEKALTTLQKADEEGWHITYLAPATATAAEFKKAIGWFDDNVKIPRGPVLGRNHYPAEESAESVRRELLASLKSRFRGPMLAIVKSTEAARTCKELGVPALRIGDPPEGLRWIDVPVRLK